MQIKSNMAFRPIQEICADLAAAIAAAGVTQKEIQRLTGVNQAQISRILSGEVRRVSKNVIQICKYANIDFLISLDFQLIENRAFMQVIENAVAGDPQRAYAIANVVKAVARALDAQSVNVG